MYAYKLMNERKDGTLGTLFINRKARYNIGGHMVARSIPTKGFALRPFIHCMADPIAPHLVKGKRVWVCVRIVGPWKPHIYRDRTWVLANEIQLMWKI